MTKNDLKTIASRLAGVQASEVVQASSGGNSRVYMVATPNKLYALKEYPCVESDPRDRLGTEKKALELMHAHGVHSVPVWVAGEAPYALMSWIDGFIIKEPKAQDIDDAGVFLGTLHHISKHVPEADFALASEACLSGQIIIDQLEARVAKLMPIAGDNKALMAFLSKTFLPVFTKRLMAAKKAVPSFTEPLPHAHRTLIAADFGFHNIMRTLDGQLYFIDFEYFGWDDPVKLMCDFLLHPATTLTDEMRRNFYNHMLAIYGKSIAARFAAFYPLFGLRWALILLNEFIPERWEIRKAAKGNLDWESVKTEQLAKAEAMLARSENFA